MILTCKSCSTRYSIDPKQLVPNGKQVRCIRCGYAWIEQPPDDMPHLMDEKVDALEKTSHSSGEGVHISNIVDDNVVSNLSETKNSYKQSQTTRNSVPASTTRKNSKLILLRDWGIFFAFIFLVTSGYFFRTEVSNFWPPSIKIYESLGLMDPMIYTLVIGNIEPKKETIGNDLILIVNGNITNISSNIQSIPKLKGVIIGPDSEELFSWTFFSSEKYIEPGKTLLFNSRVIDPPINSQEVFVTFVE